MVGALFHTNASSSCGGGLSALFCGGGSDKNNNASATDDKCYEYNIASGMWMEKDFTMSQGRSDHVAIR